MCWTRWKNQNDMRNPSTPFPSSISCTVCEITVAEPGLLPQYN